MCKIILFSDCFDFVMIFRIDDKNKKASVKLHGKELIIEGTYDIKGQILILPISGNGPAHIKFGRNFLYIK